MAEATDTSDDRESTLGRLGREYDSLRERLVFALCREFRLRLHEAEDLADEALGKAVASIARFDPTRKVKLSTWVHSIARRCALDYLRSAERRRATVNIDDLDTRREPPSHPDPADIFWQKRLAAALRDEASKLPWLQGEAVRLCGLEGMSHAEAARVLGVPIRRYRDALYKGRGKLGRNRRLRTLYYGSDYSPRDKRTKQNRTEGHG
jgi:RNA polymerase sigma-70 factor (ECF subfamily)